ncbi:MAG: adenosine kinase [Bacteroidales bacterium]|nr:adenosine kinase [Bacteroidales bacterium]
MKGILAIGNAITDVLVVLPNDNILQQLGFKKGSMQLVDMHTIHNLSKELKPHIKEIKSGGSAGNTIYGIASFQFPSSYIGKIGNDEIGELYKKDMENQGVKVNFSHSETHSGMAIAMITPDSERTFATYLGAAAELTFNDIDESYFNNHQLLHLEGYLVYDEHLLLHAAEIAKKHGLKISFDMASFNVVQDKKDFISDFLKKYVDIVFSNEEEAYAFCGEKSETSAKILARYCDIAVVKMGSNGSVIAQGNNIIKIPAIPSNVVDTTGAGDWYASGFLYAWCNKFPLERCGKIASFLAGKVIEHIGAKIPNHLLPQIINSAKNL